MISIHPAFDRVLGGGLLPGVLTHVYGTPSSGKTNFALMAAAAASKEGRVVYVDPEGGFSTERLKQITSQDFNEVLSKILLIEPTSFDEQKVAISKADEIVAKGGVSLLIVDSIALLYRILEDKDIREFGRMLAQLLRIARKHDIPVLMINQVYTDIDSGKITPVGGSINEYWSKIMLETGVLENGARFLVLRKHLHAKEGARLDYQITADGIKPVRHSIELATRSV